MLLEGARRCEAVRSCYVPMSHATAASLSPRSLFILYRSPPPRGRSPLHIPLH